MGDSASLANVVSAIQAGNQQLGSLINALKSVFPQVSAITVGTVTLAASASTTVQQPLVTANSFILPFPTNASAGALMGSAKSLYVSARTANTSFVLSTANATAAAGTETFMYILVNI